MKLNLYKLKNSQFKIIFKILLSQTALSHLNHFKNPNFDLKTQSTSKSTQLLSIFITFTNILATTSLKWIASRLCPLKKFNFASYNGNKRTKAILFQFIIFPPHALVL